jgi:hypothetical protein
MDFLSRRRLGISLVVLFGLSTIAMAVDAFPPLVNWAAPATYTPARSSGARTLGDITNVLPFIGVTPCRQFDIRPGTLADNTPLFITLTGAPCGIPTGVAQAVSLNITIFSISGAGGNGVFKVGTANPPATAWINYPPTETQRGNAGALPLAGGGIWVEVNQGGGSIQLTVDVNGYYPTGSSSQLLAPGQHMEIAGTTDPPFAMLDSRNNSTTSGAMAFLGIAGGASGATIGIFGESDSSSGGVGVHGQAVFRGIEGVATANDSCGVCGISMASTAGSSGVSAFPGTGATFAALFTTGNFVALGTKSFVEPDATDPTKMINYVAIEAPEPRTFFTGRGRFENRMATIQVPEHFRLVTDPEGLTVQVTPIGAMSNVAVLDINLDQIVVQSSRDVEFFYTVTGIRSAFKSHQTVQENLVFRPDGAGGAHDIRQDLTPAAKAAMIQNGTLNPDGTWNKEMASRLGWRVPVDDK